MLNHAEPNALNEPWFCALLAAVPVLLAAVVVFVASLRLI
jgi:hypothetical protein